jgi:Ca2+/Na+ antiporter
MSAGAGLTIRSFLERWVWIYDIFGFIILSNIFKYQTRWTYYFPEWDNFLSFGHWKDFFGENGFLPFVGAGIIAIFYLGKSFAKSNIEILVGLFSSDRIPQEISVTRDRKKFVLMLIFNFVTFVLLELVLNIPLVVCLGFLALYVFYLYLNATQRKVIRQVTTDPVFAPSPHDPHRPFIERRRAAAFEYLFKKSHTAREFIVIIASIIGIMMIFAQYVWGLTFGSNAAYALLSGAILLNELLVAQWRGAVGRKFDDINDDQIADDIRRTSQRRHEL